MIRTTELSETIYYKDRPFLYNWYSSNGNIIGQEVWVYDTSVFADGLLTQYRDMRSVEQGSLLLHHGCRRDAASY